MLIYCKRRVIVKPEGRSYILEARYIHKNFAISKLFILLWMNNYQQVGSEKRQPDKKLYFLKRTVYI